MKRIKASENEHQWPRQTVNSVKCRKRDLVIRIADWTHTKDEPTFDVEVYIGGVYDWNQSKCCRTKTEAITFAQAKIAEVL